MAHAQVRPPEIGSGERLRALRAHAQAGFRQPIARLREQRQGILARDDGIARGGTLAHDIGHQASLRQPPRRERKAHVHALGGALDSFAGACPLDRDLSGSACTEELRMQLRQRKRLFHQNAQAGSEDLFRAGG